MLDTDHIEPQQEDGHVAPLSEQASRESSKQVINEISDIAVKITEAQGKIKKLRGDRKQYLVTTFSLVLGDALITVFKKNIFNGNSFGYNTAFWILATLAILIGIAALGVQGNILNLQSDIDIFLMRTNIINVFSGVGQEKEKTYFDSLVQINVENLAAYYTLVKVHTDKSFLVSIITGVIGFILIAVGLIAGFTMSANIIAYMTSGSGILTEFIASIFFYLHNRNIAQMKSYHDSLLNVQNILLAFKLVEDTRDETEKAKMVGQMLTYLVSKQGMPIEKVNNSV